MTDLATAIISGLGGFWLWQAVNLPGSPLTPLRRLLARIPRLGEHFVRCPFCLGGWLTAALTVGASAATDQLTPATPFVALGAAGICGIIGSYLPADED